MTRPTWRRAPPSRSARARGVAGIVVVVVSLAGCGIPRDDGPRAVPRGQVDPGLLTPATPAPSGGATTTSSAFEVAFVSGGEDASAEHLVLRRRPLTARGVQAQLGQLLAELVAGPRNDEQAEGLSTALPGGTVLTITGFARGVVDVDIAGDAPDGDPERLPLSVGQIVMTLTSHPAVTAVRLTRNGTVVEAPLPGGQLTAGPLTSAEYSELTQPPGGAAATTAGVAVP